MAFTCESLRGSLERALCVRLENGEVDDARLEDEPAVPWSPSALDGDEGKKLRRWILGLRSGGKSILERSESLFRAMMAPVARGGLGLAFDAEESGPARGAMDVYRDRKANCVEFVSFFLMAADLLKLPAVAMELFEDAEGNFVDHVRVGIPDPDTGEIANVADLADGHFGPPADMERGAPQTRREFLSDFYNLKAVREKDPASAESDVDFALRLDPRNHLGLYNKAYYAAHRGKQTRAFSYLLKSIAANPRYPLAYWNLARVADQLNQPDVASWALERYRGLFPAL